MAASSAAAWSPEAATPAPGGIHGSTSCCRREALMGRLLPLLPPPPPPPAAAAATPARNDALSGRDEGPGTPGSNAPGAAVRWEPLLPGRWDAALTGRRLLGRREGLAPPLIGRSAGREPPRARACVMLCRRSRLIVIGTTGAWVAAGASPGAPASYSALPWYP